MLQDYWYLMALITALSVAFCYWQRLGRGKTLAVLGIAGATLISAVMATARGWLDGPSATLLYGVIVACLPVVLTPVRDVIES